MKSLMRNVGYWALASVGIAAGGAGWFVAGCDPAGDCRQTGVCCPDGTMTCFTSSS
jgi:hypothetical protein